MRAGLVALLAALATVLTAAGGTPASAQQDRSPIELAVSPARPVFRPGEPVTLLVTVTNRADSSCLLAAAADGTMSLAVTRDAAPVAAAFAPITYIDGHAGSLQPYTRLVAPGESLSFTLTGEPGQSQQSLRAVTSTAGGGALAAYWPVAEPGDYMVRAFYRMPTAAPECAGANRPAVAEFTVSAGTEPLRHPLLWGAAAVLLLLLVVAGGVFFLRRRRASAGAVALLIAVAVTVIVGRPTPARATIEIDDLGKPENLGFAEATEACLNEIRTRLGADAIGVMDALDDPNFKVVIRPTKGSGEATHFDKRSVIKFNPKPEGTYNGESTPLHGCAVLYHELVHAHDNATDQLDGRRCKVGADGKPTRNGPEMQEVRAVRAENHFRASKGLPQRKSYSGLPLPPGRDPSRSQVLKDCAEQPQEPPKDKPPTHSELPGASNGDPHLITFDQRRYDFQAVGEFLLAKSGDFEVHVRQAPVPGLRWASVNSAVALRTGPGRITFSLYDGTPEIRVDGNVVDHARPPAELPGGAMLATTDNGYTLTWPDRSTAEITYIGFWGITVLLYPSARHEGRLTGLLGDFDGNPANDLTTADGAQLPADPGHPELYGRFADAWRLTRSASLLDYPPGTDTGTFTDRTFPDRIAAVADLDPDQRASAQRICAQLGVTDTTGLNDCTLDLVLTGQPAFAISSAAVEEQITPATPYASPGQTVRDAMIVSGTIGTPGEALTYPLDAGGATVVRLVDVTGENGRSGTATLRVAVDGPDASAQPGFTVTSVYQYKVDPAAASTLRVQRAADDTGDFRFRVVTAKERRIPTTGGSVTGRLDVPGRVDLRAFRATRAGSLQLADGVGCDFSVAVVEDTPAPRVYTPAKLCWEISLASLEPGKDYLLVVWSDVAAVGDYRFSFNP